MVLKLNGKEEEKKTSFTIVIDSIKAQKLPHNNPSYISFINQKLSAQHEGRKQRAHTSTKITHSLQYISNVRSKVTE